MKHTLTFLAILLLAPLAFSEIELPNEPFEIGFEPQLFVDAYMVDNRWPLQYAMR